MRVMFAALAMALVATSAHAASSAFLTCDGFDFFLGTTVRHIAEIRADSAQWDGRTYALESSPTFYTLRGPLPNDPKVVDILRAPVTISISRVDGTYTVENKAEIGHGADWSRPEDAGCLATGRRF